MDFFYNTHHFKDGKKNLKIKELEDKKTKKFLEFFKQNLEKRKLVKVYA